MKLSRKEQADDVSCAVYAVQALLETNHIRSNLWDVRKGVLVNPERGVDHMHIKLYLASFVEFIEWTHKSDVRTLPVPVLVNYQWEGDGHYGVITRITSSLVDIISNGSLTRVPIKEFNKRWYSERYGKRWALRIL